MSDKIKYQLGPGHCASGWGGRETGPCLYLEDEVLALLKAERERWTKALAASCDEERDQFFEAGPGGGCARAIEAEAKVRRLSAALLDSQAALRRAFSAHVQAGEQSGLPFDMSCAEGVSSVEWLGVSPRCSPVTK
jgi:hypothetical protein